MVDKWHEFKPTWDDSKEIQVVIALVEDWIMEHHNLYGFTKAVLDQYNSQSTIQRLQGKLPIEELVWTVANKTKAFSKLRELFNLKPLNFTPTLKAFSS